MVKQHERESKANQRTSTRSKENEKTPHKTQYGTLRTVQQMNARGGNNKANKHIEGSTQ